MSLLDLLVIVGLKRRPFYVIACFGVACSLVLPFFVPKYFTSTVVLMMPTQPQSAVAGALSQIGALSGALGGSGLTKTPDELYISLLKSRTVTEAVVEANGLVEAYGADDVEGAAKELLANVVITSERKSGLITIAVDDKDAVRASRIANSFMPELEKLMSRLAVTEAQQRRKFFEKQVDLTQAKLDSAENEFQKLQFEKGLVVPDVLAQGRVSAAMAVRSQILAKEVQLQSLQVVATADNPSTKILSREISALRGKLLDLEQGRGGTDHVVQSPALLALRNVKVLQMTLEVLLKQLEVARLDEAKEGVGLQLVDQARPPKIPSKPRRLFLFVGGVVGSILISAVLVIVFHLSYVFCAGHQVGGRVLLEAWRSGRRE